MPRAISFFFERGAGFGEAAELFFVEVGVLSESHHGALNLGRLAGGNVADERDGLVVRNTDPADPSVDADVQRHGPLKLGGDFVDGRAERSVNHRQNVASDSVRKVLLVEGTEQKDGLLYARVAKRVRFVKFDDGEAEDFTLGLEELSDVGDSRAVAIVFDHGEDGTGANAPGDFLNIMPEVFTMGFDPGVEGGILRGKYIDVRGKLKKGWPATECSW